MLRPVALTVLPLLVVSAAERATDVVWDGWDRQFKAPRALSPYGR